MELLPTGRIKGRDGRLFVLDNAQGVMNASVTPGAGLPIDCEHRGDDPARRANGPVPAAGRITELQLRDGAIRGRVSRTEKAANMIAAREYRHLSPVIACRSDRRGRGCSRPSPVRGTPRTASRWARQRRGRGAADGTRRDSPVPGTGDGRRGRREVTGGRRAGDGRAMRGRAVSLGLPEPESFDAFVATAIPVYARLVQRHAQRPGARLSAPARAAQQGGAGDRPQSGRRSGAAPRMTILPGGASRRKPAAGAGLLPGTPAAGTNRERTP